MPRIQMKNGVAAAGPDSSPVTETPLSCRRATAVGRAALYCLIRDENAMDCLASFMPL